MAFPILNFNLHLDLPYAMCDFHYFHERLQVSVNSYKRAGSKVYINEKSIL